MALLESKESTSTSSEIISQTPTINTEVPSLKSQPNRHTIGSKTGLITHVRVYSNRAEITRLFKFNVKTGQNQINITGLPKVLDPESVRADYEPRVDLEGVTIHAVTVSVIVPASKPMSEGLKEKKRKGEKACERAKKSLPTLETYLGLLNIEPLNAQTLLEAVKKYETAAAEQEEDIIRLDRELAKINKEIQEEKERFSGPPVISELNLQAAISIFAPSDHEIKIRLIYVVQNASWKAAYDINVGPQDKESEDSKSLTVGLTYKGSITQSTGEDWNDVQSLTLETATPTFRLEVPTLTPWNIPIHRQPQNVKKSSAMSSTSARASRVNASSPPVRSNRRILLNQSSNKPEVQQGLDGGKIVIPFETKSINIANGGMAHIVNIPLSSSKLEATKSYVCVPRKDTKTYLNAKIKNPLDGCTFLSGQANVYVNNKFVMKSSVPFVSPGGTFDCPYGVEPSIRVTYHPSYRNISTSGFFTKTIHHIYSQHITIFNTTKDPIAGTLKIIDQAPISNSDSDFTVEMVSPKLGTSGEGFNGGIVLDTNHNRRAGLVEGEAKALPKNLSVNVMKGIIAQWHGAEEAKVTGDVESLGGDGKFEWVCSDGIDAEEKIKLLLQWKVSVPASVKKTDVADLTALSNVRL